MSEISIYIENLYDHFQSHLDNNKRILFSGAYGVGKTYFMREFFSDPKFCCDYNVFHLFPVNYQVSNNEDIFELIKLDILYNILGKKWAFDEIQRQKISKTLALQAYTLNKSSSAFKAVIQILTLGKSKSVAEAAINLQKIITGFTDYYEELNTVHGSLDKIKEFAEIFENKKGSIYEFDSTTQLICELLEEHSKVKAEEIEGIETDEEKYEAKRKESILIIDDLDRIDPEHIFRILNVFSAHFDIRNEDGNKFGFDKVIFVCDIENIRNVFSVKYGVSSDFNGYINKFFSSYIYYFENKKEVRSAAKQFLENKLLDSKTNCRLALLKNEIIELLGIFVDSNTINIRHLKNLERFDYGTSFSDYYPDRYLVMQNYWHLINFLFKIFNNDKSKLLEAFSSLNMSEDIAKDFFIDVHYYLRFLLPLLSIGEISIRAQIKATDTNFFYSNEELDINVSYELINSGRSFFAENISIVSLANRNKLMDKRELEKESVEKVQLEMHDVFKLFIVAIDILDKKGFLIR